MVFVLASRSRRLVSLESVVFIFNSWEATIVMIGFVREGWLGSLQ